MTNGPPFTQIAVTTNPNSGTPSLFAIDSDGRVWQYIFTPKGNGPPYWLPLNPERRTDA